MFVLWLTYEAKNAATRLHLFLIGMHSIAVLVLNNQVWPPITVGVKHIPHYEAMTLPSPSGGGKKRPYGLRFH